MDHTKILKQAQSILPWLIETRRSFHMQPETAMAEYKTRDRICLLLNEMGIGHKAVAKTGVIGHIRAKHPGKTIALRADIDALPMDDKKTTSYCSAIDGKMHACGHDVHTTILLGAAKLLSQMKHNLPHNIILVFQPAEETCEGAKALIREGALDSPKPDAIFALHSAPRFKSGQIGIKAGTYAAASDAIDVRIKGRSSHGARPYQGIDAIVIAAHFITAAQTIISRNISAHDRAVLSFGQIQGGDKRNIIANEVFIQGTLRTLSPDIRKNVLRRIEEMVAQLPDSFGGKGSIAVRPGACLLQNDTAMIDHIRKNGELLLGKDNVVREKYPSMGVEDFAFYLESIPGAIFSLGTRGEDETTSHPVHTNLFDVDETAMVYGVALQTMNVLAL
ncbi:MAG: M20 family metallopeptidase [Desulfobacterales bacterium]|nr:M20 family metallopeptidase [Desulfobacterales bacterium]